ncbi:MAG: hypothetical protein FWG54_01685 [Bacteroidetes bacterium]|nr:hypothetical protein [Bacteroidota bacterium]
MIEKEHISQEEIKLLAGQVLYKTNLLIHLCNNILPEEEGVKSVFRRFQRTKKRQLKTME